MARDLRRYSRNTYAGLLIGFILLLIFVGDGLIWIIYGKQAAILGLVCMLVGLAPILLIVVVLFGIDLLTKKYRD
jgi:hypothetical protein